ncbi:Colistin resistance protein EmrA [Pararobbsia alpina]|uniref:Colistin resistance protein EmrA n=1 Tax=Pararobbsia alpina TaxID=621374 RepID=A0A6S7C2L9_9BURK|nr:Colistin resistance protein EmrA [Pararobbsia alpina]
MVDTSKRNTEHGTDRKVGAGKILTRVIAALAAASLVVVGGVEGAHYWKVGRFIESTDDAYVQADSTIVAPKVSGYIADVMVDDNQSVKSGQRLARIDDRDLRTALDDATANVAAATAAVAHLDAQLAAQGSLIRQADASVTAAAASLSLSQRNDVRRHEMAEVGYGSVEQADSASTDAKEGRANLERLQAAALTARQQVGILTTQRQLAEAQLARTEASKHQAELNLSYTGIVAPIDGTVAARSVRVGQYVQAGTQLMALVPLQRVYVIANFKETQLTGVQPGQPAIVRVDAFPDHDLVGHVDTIAPASGMEFSLLPPDNATGNFTKIVQRVPVKIVFSLDEALAGRIRPGMSVEAQIDTRTQAVSRIAGK